MTTRSAMVTAVMGPCIVLAAASAWWSGIVGPGLWPPDQVTLSEAVVTRNNAEALRLIRLGANPNQPSTVRAGLLTSDDLTMLPVEAAVGAQREDSLRTLLANGVVIDDRELTILRCFEQVRRNSDVREILEARAASGPQTAPEPDCAGVRLPITPVTK